MDSLWRILIQFVFRLTFGVAWSMRWTAPQPVTSGFFRVHLWVLMGLNTLAALAVLTLRQGDSPAVVDRTDLGLAVGLAVASYGGAVGWLYEQRRLGGWVLALLALLGGLAAVRVELLPAMSPAAALHAAANALSSGLLTGSVLTAMLLGHWYLNTPGMPLAPLRRLVGTIFAAVAIRALISGAGLALVVGSGADLRSTFWIFVALRWMTGLLGVAGLAALTWLTLKVPNTQSATGILYAGVILCFLGELTSQLLSVDTAYAV